MAVVAGARLGDIERLVERSELRQLDAAAPVADRCPSLGAGPSRDSSALAGGGELSDVVVGSGSGSEPPQPAATAVVASTTSANLVDRLQPRTTADVAGRRPRPALSRYGAITR